MSELPNGWVSTTISEIAKVESGVGFPKKYQGMDTKEIPVYKVGDISKSVQAGKSSLNESSNYIDETVRLAMKGKLYPVGSTLFAKIGEALRLNRRGYLSLTGIADNNVMGVIPEPLIESKILFYFLRTVDLSVFSRSSTVPSIRKGDVQDLPCKLAPLNEQKRIVEKLDEVLAQVDTIKTRLDGIPAILKRFRQSVLAAAVSGKLTEEWRGSNNNSPVESLIEKCIVTDRRNNKNALKAFRVDEIKFNIPDTWAWVRLSRITEVVSGVAKGSKTKSEVVSRPYLRVANVQRGYLDLNEVKDILVPVEKAKNLKLLKGDILFNEGGDIDKLGRGWVWEEQIENCIHQNHVFRARCYSSDIEPKFISHYGNSSGKEYFLREGTQSVNLANINKTTLSLLPIPLPPKEEQKEIVRLVDQYFAFANTIEAQVKKAQTRVDNLTQSILAKAFRGELVAQDPNDEPADKLLERIAVARKEAEALAKAAKKAAPKKRAAKKAT
ncbi:TPA: restriction endonuclease subunit S [Photobacterium damselae]